jgi:hypothetical protein
VSTFLGLFFFALISPNCPLFFFRSAAASDPKDSKQRIKDEVVGDDTGAERDVPSVIVDLLKSSASVASGQTLPSTNLQVDAAASGAARGQILPSASRPSSSSTLCAVTAPKVLKARKLNVKKSSV